MVFERGYGLRRRVERRGRALRHLACGTVVRDDDGRIDHERLLFPPGARIALPRLDRLAAAGGLRGFLAGLNPGHSRSEHRRQHANAAVAAERVHRAREAAAHAPGTAVAIAHPVAMLPGRPARTAFAVQPLAVRRERRQPAVLRLTSIEVRLPRLVVSNQVSSRCGKGRRDLVRRARAVHRCGSMLILSRLSGDTRREGSLACSGLPIVLDPADGHLDIAHVHSAGRHAVEFVLPIGAHGKVVREAVALGREVLEARLLGRE